MDIVLGVSMAPASVHMVLLQGENADGVTVDEHAFAVTAADDSPTVSATDRVIAAILGSREDAAGAGLELNSIGVACTDQLEAAAIRDALAAHKMENVMLVSAFLAATTLAQSVGGAMGYECTAMLFVEPDTATLAVVETSDGSIADVRKEHFGSGPIATAELTKMIAGLDELPTRPGGLFIVGSGVDVAPIKSHLEETTSLPVSAPEEPETALARGAALASANAALFASSTAALAYAQDPDAELGVDDPAYDAAADDEASAPTTVIPGSDEREPRRRPALLIGTAVAVAGISAVVALEIALALGLRTTVGLLPIPGHELIAPILQAPARTPGQAAAPKAVSKPLSPPAGAPSPAAAIPAAPPPAAPAVPAPEVVVPPPASAPVPPVQLPDPQVIPPVIQAPSPPAEPPPIRVPPPHSPPPHQTPPGHGPWPNPGSPGGGGPVSGPGPIHGNPGGGGPRGGEPGTGPGSGHGSPGQGPPESGAPTGGGPRGGEPGTGPGAGHGSPGQGPPESGAPTGGGVPTGGGEPHGGGAPVGGAEPPSAGAPVGGGESHGGGETSGGAGGSSAPVGGGETSGGAGGSSAPVGGGETSGGGSSGGGAGESGGAGHH
jgi:hypothetical protein